MLGISKLKRALGMQPVKDVYFERTRVFTQIENDKRPLRSQIINDILTLFEGTTTYLEIGLRNPEDNFAKISATHKHSVDPGYEYEANPADYKMISDAFFSELDAGTILSHDIRFDVVFIDGSHLADQVDKDIENAMRYLSEKGVIVLHDCNPPTIWHARETRDATFSPSANVWNGTTWKAFYKWRTQQGVYSCCIDTDWGVGLLSRHYNFGRPVEIYNRFFEYAELEKNRTRDLNLISYDDFCNLIGK